MEKTCGNCGHAKVCAVFISGETGCCQWSPCVDTLKQSYQQLTEVAREMYEDLDDLPSGAEGFRRQLEELGVEL